MATQNVSSGKSTNGVVLLAPKTSSNSNSTSAPSSASSVTTPKDFAPDNSGRFVGGVATPTVSTPSAPSTTTIQNKQPQVYPVVSSDLAQKDLAAKNANFNQIQAGMQDQQLANLQNKANQQTVAQNQANIDSQNAPSKTLNEIKAAVSGDNGNQSDTTSALQDVFNEQTKAYADYKTQVDQLRQGAFPLTADQQAIVNSTQQQFDRLEQQQKVANQNYEAAMAQLGITSGRSRYAPEIQTGLMQQAVSDGITKISDIELKATNEVATLRQGFQDKNYQMINDSYKNLTDLLAQKGNTINEIAQNVREEAQLALQQQQFDYTKQKAVDDVVLAAAQVGADPDTLAKIANSGSTAEAIANSNGFLGTEYRDKMKQQEFDNNVKLQQLLIDQAKVDAANVGMSQEDLIAYAQQYAATGQIPTGLPKGSFGAVSQVAGALPKPDGTVIDAATGVKASKLSSTQMDSIVALKDLQTKLDDAQTLFKTFRTGLIAGVWNKLHPTEQQTAYNVLRGEIVDLLARARSGAALTADEVAQYEAKIPSRFVNGFWTGPEGTDLLKGLQSSLKGKLDTTLKANGVQIIGYGDGAAKSQDMQRAGQFDDTTTDASGNVVKGITQKLAPLPLMTFNGASSYTPLQNRNLQYGPQIPANLKVSIGAGAGVKNNNPGNLRNTDGSWMHFTSPQEGFKALAGYLERAKNGDHKAYSPTQTLYQFFSKYAPAADSNNPKAYAESVARALGISPSSIIKNINTFDWAKAIAKHESNTTIG